MKDVYIYPAIFTYADDGISIEFPGLEGAYTCGDTEEEALYMAKDCLELHLYGMEEDGETIPEALKIRDIKLGEDQSVVMVRVNMKPVRDEMQNKAVKKTLTIPKWLNDAALKQHINFSALLKSALMDELEINH
ncbi:type II toxin-antitoxin system HicB family antitoxin [Ilyobacter polytropus]|uniref:HicB-like antitoxin of toxin-antitoxin system domain-containing protein n=1 Tax=Ilyobacter polytropus (strain ATCC 51220 / DSM 2926 / LMG 16218 / CuHBu1) TaxID=572544 RepID=E3HBJ6_ILYPC|nr:type II toxin-antitoxin system HicB family antitoxin [Ilyobacter polytropus]ADO83692.1 protein of unknown function UPF0150 [Ilyobacter polytropus DSM 2926]